MTRALRLAAASALLLCHCGGSPALRAADEGRVTGLSALVDAEVKRGEMGPGEAAHLARILLRREVATASGADGVTRIQVLEGCARFVAGELERRAEKDDAVAAAAAMVRLESGLADADDFAPWAAEPPGGPRAAFRAVGARALVGPKDGDLRRSLFNDGDQDVRLAALRASERAASAGDMEPLLEAARLDPYPMARTQAVRAAGAVGGERVVLALKDLWATADEPLREAIADAWAAPAAINAGGRRELSWAADAGLGAPSVAAAYALVRTGGGMASIAGFVPTKPGMPFQGPGVADALGVLERAIKSGVARDRLFAIGVAPLAVAPLQKAVAEASADADDDVALAATSRRLDAAPSQGGAAAADRPALVAKLMGYASADGNKVRALLAKSALARAGAREVLPLLERDAASADPQTRKAAGTALVALGELGRAAVLAADADARVRAPVACAILHAAP
jgi:HEAT repeats